MVKIKRYLKIIQIIPPLSLNRPNKFLRKYEFIAVHMSHPLQTAKS